MPSRSACQDLWGTRHYLYDTNQAQTWTLSNGVPSSITEYARPLEDLEHLKAELGIYAQDRWTIKTLTINLGLRFDWHNAYVPAQDRPPITFVIDAAALRPDRRCAELEGHHAAGGRRLGHLRATAAPCSRANYGHYLAAESTATATANNPLNTSINNASRTWRDLERQFLPRLRSRQPGGATANAWRSASRSARSTSSPNSTRRCCRGGASVRTITRSTSAWRIRSRAAWRSTGSTPITGSAISSRPRTAPIPRRTTTATA